MTQDSELELLKEISRRSKIFLCVNTSVVVSGCVAFVASQFLVISEAALTSAAAGAALGGIAGSLTTLFLMKRFIKQQQEIRQEFLLKMRDEYKR